MMFYEFIVLRLFTCCVYFVDVCWVLFCLRCEVIVFLTLVCQWVALVC